MLRSVLAAKVGFVLPALAASNLLPIMSHVWFTGSQIMAFNDRIALSVPMKTSVKGAVPGKVLNGLLTSSTVKEADLEMKEDTLRLRVGNMRIKLATMPAAEFTGLFKIPKPHEKAVVPMDIGRLVVAGRGCLRSISSKVTSTELDSVTVVIDGDEAILYASDINTLSTDRVKLTAKAGKGRYMVPSEFFKVMAGLPADALEGRLELHDEYVMYNFGMTFGEGSEDCHLWARCYTMENAPSFESTIQTNFSSTNRKKMVKVPDMLETLLDRAILMMKTGGKTYSEFEVRDGSLWITTEQIVGELRDAVKLPGHSNVMTRFDPREIRTGIKEFSTLLLTSRCAIMASGDAVYLVAASEE